jgi:undecaprenyl-diphosphatase
MIYLKAVLLAIVEGITEFLPISSTGHLILVNEFVKLSADESFSKAFMVAIQLPAILSVVIYFWDKLWPFGKGQDHFRTTFNVWFRVVVAFIPMAVIAFLLDDYVESLITQRGDDHRRNAPRRLAGHGG